MNFNFIIIFLFLNALIWAQKAQKICDPLLGLELCSRFTLFQPSTQDSIFFDSLLKMADEKGFPFAEIIKKDSLFEFNSGGQWGLGGVIHNGVEKEILMSVTGLKRDQIWDSKKQKEALQKLRKMEYFGAISEGKIFKNERRNILYQEWVLEEKSKQEFEVTGGGDPRSGEFEGVGIARFKNLFFSFRDLDLSFERLRTKQLWSVHYKEYSPLGWPFWYDFMAHSERLDSTQNSWSISGGVSYEFILDFELSWSGRWKEMNFLNLKDTLSDYVLQEQFIAIQKIKERNKEDWFAYAQLGWGVVDDSDFERNQPKFKLGLELNYSFMNIWIEPQLHYLQLWLENSELYKDEWFKFGGAQSLRGHREQEIWATQAMQMRMQLGTPPAPLRAFIFWDKVNYKQTSVQDWKKAQGWGFGFNLSSETLDLTMAYAWPTWTGQQDWTSGYLHFKLNQYF
jgi:hypothetical protein